MPRRRDRQGGLAARIPPTASWDASRQNRRRLYCGCRDGRFLALRKHDGEPLWSRDLGGAAIAGPALDRAGDEDLPERLYAVGITGGLVAINPTSGEEVWARAMGDGVTPVEAISTPALVSVATRTASWCVACTSA